MKSFRYNFDVYRCCNCGVMFRYPFPSSEDLQSFYTEGYYSGISFYSYVDERSIKGSHLVWDRRLKRLMEIYKKENNSYPRTILDVGCSFGGFLERAKLFGLEPYGIEISEYAYTYAVQRGLTVFKGDVSNVCLDQNKFDMITMIEVIEHLEDPRRVITKLYNSTTKGGLILIQTANMNGLQSKFWGNKYHYYLPGHLHYFTNKTLRRLLFDVGYKKVYEFYPVEFGLFPKLVKVFLNTNRIYRVLRLLKTAAYHILGKIRFGDLTIMSSMVMVGIK
ncbi:MAG: class I SAM-dependent methyltransferase [Brevinematales bacterium]|nr:class I SAM-dependent methyltransferase [Brevinematales bacterium]